jgi:hypothetical protein
MADMIVSNITNNFSVEIVGHPTLGYHIVSVSQPGISTDAEDYYYRDTRIRQPKRTVEPVKSDLILTFNVDEDYNNYFRIFDWIRSYKREGTVESKVSNILIRHYNLNKKPVRLITLTHCFPIDISSLDLETSSSEAEPVKFVSTFVINDMFIDAL